MTKLFATGVRTGTHYILSNNLERDYKLAEMGKDEYIQTMKDINPQLTNIYARYEEE